MFFYDVLYKCVLYLFTMFYIDAVFSAVEAIVNMLAFAFAFLSKSNFVFGN